MSLKDSDITEEDKALLTPEELEALAEGDEVDDDDPNAEGNQDMDKDADGKRKPKAAAEDEDDDEAEAKEPSRDDGDEDAAKADADKPVERLVLEPADEDDDDLDSYRPAMPAGVPADAQDRIDALVAEREELLVKFNDGDIDTVAYEKQRNVIGDKLASVQHEVSRAEDANKAYTDALVGDWNRVCAKFMKQNPVFASDATLMRALDAEVKFLAKPEENKDGLTDRQILRKAHATIVNRFNAKEEAPAKGSTKKTGAEPPVVKHKAAPPTLAKMPAAEAPDTDEGKFAALDRMAARDPVAYEERLLKMSADDRAEYEQA